MDTFIIVAISFAVTIGLAWVLFRQELKRVKQEDRKKYQALLKKVEEESDARDILARLDVGVLYYVSDMSLAFSNPAANELLGEIPDDFTGFLETFSVDNGMSAQIALGKQTTSAIVKRGDFVVYINVQNLEDSPSKGHLVLVRDATRQFLEEQQRKEYVSNVSHELRTPLTTIKSYSESLVDWGVEEKQKDQIKKDVNRIYEEANHMEQLISNLSLLSSLDEKSIGRNMHVEVVDVVWLVKNLLERLQPQAEERQLELVSYTMNQISPIYADRSQLERILTNLLTNALKYTNAGGHISVYMGSIRDQVYIKVKDDGVGIDEQYQKLIFERFYRVDDSRTRASGGRGLGLAIVKELVELNNGEISVSSHIGVGSEFTLTFPSRQKTLKDTLYQLSRYGEAEDSYIGKAAEADLRDLAESLDIVAQWGSLSERDYKLLLLSQMEDS